MSQETVFVSDYDYAYAFQRKNLEEQAFCLVLECPFPNSLKAEHLIRLHAKWQNRALALFDDEGRAWILFEDVPHSEVGIKPDRLLLLHPDIDGFIVYDLETN